MRPNAQRGLCPGPKPEGQYQRRRQGGFWPASAWVGRVYLRSAMHAVVAAIRCIGDCGSKISRYRSGHDR